MTLFTFHWLAPAAGESEKCRLLVEHLATIIKVGIAGLKKGRIDILYQSDIS